MNAADSPHAGPKTFRRNWHLTTAPEYPRVAVCGKGAAITVADMENEAQLTLNWQVYEPDLKELCTLKAEEFRLLGYEDVSGDDVWNCIRSTHRGAITLHELVAAVLGLQVGKFMNFTTVNAFKGVFDSDQTGKKRF